MSTKNSTANQSLGNATIAIPVRENTIRIYDYPFFDPAWQLAITIEFYFHYAVIAIGMFGTAANALVLYALIAYHAREAKKRAINLLVTHQNLLDFISCFILVVTYSIGTRIEMTGALGYFICVTFISQSAIYTFLYASVINLALLTIERYLKIVHPFWSKKHLKRWMIYAGMAFAWIGGFLYTVPPAVTTTIMVHKVCLAYFVWESPAAKMLYTVGSNLLFFLLPLVIFVYCYGRIVVVMKRQMRVMAAHSSESSSAPTNASQRQSKRAKWNITKTMIIVSVMFSVCWLPNTIYFIVADSAINSGNLFVGYFFTLFMVYLNTCINPFIYALKHDGVKKRLGQLMSCQRCKTVAPVVDSSASTSGTVGKTKQTIPGATR